MDKPMTGQLVDIDPNCDPVNDEDIVIGGQPSDIDDGRWPNWPDSIVIVLIVVCEETRTN